MFKSIQTKLYTIGATVDTVAVTLDTPVEVGKSFVMLQAALDSGDSSPATKAGDYLVTPELTDVVDGEYTKVTLRRYYLTSGGIELEVNFTVIELATGSVTSGVHDVTGTDESVVVTNYSDGHSFSLGYLWGDYSSWSGQYDSQMIQHRVYNNGSNDVIRFKGLQSSTVKIYWQVITIPEASIQMEVVSLSGTTQDHTFGTTVDEDKTMLITSFYQDLSPHNEDDLKGCRLLSSTQIRYGSWASATAEAVTYVITHPALKVRDRGFINWSTQNTTSSLAENTHKDRSFNNITSHNQHWGLCDDTDEYFEDIGTRATLQNLSGDYYTEVRLDRGSTIGNDATTYLETIELILGFDINNSYPAGYGIGYGVGYS